MARPREFDQEAVLDAATECFWRRGYEATSVKDLIAHTGITAASLYNAFGNKRALFQTALDYYVEKSVSERIKRYEGLAPRDAIKGFFDEIISRSLKDRDHKGCMLVNSALEVAPHDAEFQTIIASVLNRLERFFLECIRKGQADGSVNRSIPAKNLAHHFLGVLMGVRVLARVKPQRAILKGVVMPALALLEHAKHDQKGPR